MVRTDIEKFHQNFANRFHKNFRLYFAAKCVEWHELIAKSATRNRKFIQHTLKPAFDLILQRHLPYVC